MNKALQEIAELCITGKLPLTIARTEKGQTHIISFIPAYYILTKTAGIIVEGKIIERAHLTSTNKVIHLTEDEFRKACLGYEMNENESN